jgi:formiminotetrahydrofolate cyclodeaminase
MDTTGRELLAAFSSTDPTPGGGSASALASAVGASLLIMVAGLPKTRTGSDDDRRALADASAALTTIRDQLAGAVDSDTAAYDRVVAAYKLPKASPEEQLARKPAIQAALKAATDVPLGVMRLSAAAMDLAAVVAAHGHRAASSDVGVAAGLLQAGAAGARLNVESNLEGIADRPYVEDARKGALALSETIERAATATAASLGLG